MSSPLKPWEKPGINYQRNSSFPVNNMSASPFGEERVSAAVNGSASAVPAIPPQVPPRVASSAPIGSRLGVGGGYGGYGNYSSYGSYSSPFGYGGMHNSPYSGYGGYGFNRPADVRSTFALQAEESSRPAFESIESIVYAVNSVGMMLDSTFQAVYSSFRAVIGVADNFTRLKSQLVQVFSALAFIRTLRYVFRKFLELLRLRPKGEADTLWREAFEAAVAASPDIQSRKSTWPIIMFFGIIMAGPYLIWKLISAFSSPSGGQGWTTGADDHFVARANFNFQGQSTEELSFSAGQSIIVAPKELQPRVRGWLLASIDGQKTGMIPANYITILGKRKGSKHTGSASTPLVHSESSSALNQASSPATIRQMYPVPEDDMELAFRSDSGPLFNNTTQVSSNSQDISQEEAVEILNRADN